MSMQIPDDQQLPGGMWNQILGLVKSGHDALAIAAQTGISQARAERYRKDLSFKPQAPAKKKWVRR